MIAIFLFSIPFFFVACNKDEDVSTGDDLETLTSEDVLTAQDLIQDTQEEIDYELENRDPEDDCPIITIDPNDGTFPRTITIDYGTEGCEGWNGRIRKGIIQVVVTDTMINEGATRTVTFIDFSVDDVQVEGVKTLTNTGLNDEGQRTFSRTVEQITIPLFGLFEGADQVGHFSILAFQTADHGVERLHDLSDFVPAGIG